MCNQTIKCTIKYLNNHKTEIVRLQQKMKKKSIPFEITTHTFYIQTNCNAYLVFRMLICVSNLENLSE